MVVKQYFGIAELAKCLNWGTEKTYVYYKRGKFLKPKAFVSDRPLWEESQVELIVDLNRKPGE